MSKGRLITLFAILFLVAGIIFAYYQKQNYTKQLEVLKQERVELQKIAALKTLWGAKGMQGKLKKLFNSVPKAKIERLDIKRNKVDAKIFSLSDREINRLLTKLAMLPLSFKKLKVVKSGNQFVLETQCVW